MKFTQCLFLPSFLVVVWWLLALPGLLFPNLSFFSSHIYESIIATIILAVAGIVVLIQLIILILKKDYRNALAVIIGIPIAGAIGTISVIVLLSTSGFS